MLVVALAFLFLIKRLLTLLAFIVFAVSTLNAGKSFAGRRDDDDDEQDDQAAQAFGRKLNQPKGARSGGPPSPAFIVAADAAAVNNFDSHRWPHRSLDARQERSASFEFNKTNFVFSLLATVYAQHLATAFLTISAASLAQNSKDYDDQGVTLKFKRGGSK